ncbi:lachesin-like isoform X5 [Vespula squamosa]|uniref:Lachesin-like isoform X5 n=1 Tax=Vespula squamosa TaxID=30214 RepID=A0ABD2BEV2_VESSQ
MSSEHPDRLQYSSKQIEKHTKRNSPIGKNIINKVAVKIISNCDTNTQQETHQIHPTIFELSKIISGSVRNLSVTCPERKSFRTTFYGLIIQNSCPGKVDIQVHPCLRKITDSFPCILTDVRLDSGYYYWEQQVVNSEENTTRAGRMTKLGIIIQVYSPRRCYEIVRGGQREESPPPSTSPSPSTTEIPKKVKPRIYFATTKLKKLILDHFYHWETITELNNSVYANPNSLTIHNEKNMKTSNKFQSNINEIGKSEQKSSDLNRKRNYNWPSDDNDAAD